MSGPLICGILWSWKCNTRKRRIQGVAGHFLFIRLQKPGTLDGLYVKVLKIILIVLASILILVLIGAAALLISVQDGTDHTPDAVSGSGDTLEKLISETVTVTLADAKDEPDIDLCLDGHEINRFLYTILTGLKNLGFVSFNGAYSVFESDGSLHVELPARLIGAQTCFYATALIEDTGSLLRITLKDAKLGRFDCTSFFIRHFILTDGLGRKLQKSLSEMGLIAKIDMDALTIESTHEDITSMICKLTEKDPNAPLYRVISDLCLSTPELLEIKTETDFISVVLHTGRMTYDESRDGIIRYPLDIESVRSRIEESEYLSSDAVTLLYNGYIKGYSKLSEEDQKIADQMGLKSEMRGIIEADATDITTALIMQKPTLPLAQLALEGSYSVVIESATASAIIANLPFVGSTIGFTDGKQSAYITLEYMSMDFSENKLRIWGILNINGRRICLDVKGFCEEATGESIPVTIDSLSFGAHQLKSSYIPDMLAYLKSVLSDQAWIIPIPDRQVIELNVAVILDNLEGFRILRAGCERAIIGLETNRLKITWQLIPKIFN